MDPTQSCLESRKLDEMKFWMEKKKKKTEEQNFSSSEYWLFPDVLFLAAAAANYWPAILIFL